jgi:hypothetical protein
VRNYYLIIIDRPAEDQLESFMGRNKIRGNWVLNLSERFKNESTYSLELNKEELMLLKISLPLVSSVKLDNIEER